MAHIQHEPTFAGSAQQRPTYSEREQEMPVQQLMRHDSPVIDEPQTECTISTWHTWRGFWLDKSLSTLSTASQHCGVTCAAKQHVLCSQVT